MDDLLKPVEVAKILGIKMNTLYHLVHDKKIPYIKLFGLKFDPKDIEKLINEHKIKKKNPKLIAYKIMNEKR